MLTVATASSHSSAVEEQGFLHSRYYMKWNEANETGCCLQKNTERKIGIDQQQQKSFADYLKLPGRGDKVKRKFK